SARPKPPFSLPSSRFPLPSSRFPLPLPPPTMPARSIGTATISFGLVSVPVNIYSSSESKTSVSFNMLHKKCGTRLKQQYICAKDGETVSRDDTVEGYDST